MRASVVISEYLVYVPSIVIFVQLYGKQAGLNSYDKVQIVSKLLILSIVPVSLTHQLLTGGGFSRDFATTGFDDY
jgi:hypothetical protein